MIEMADGRLVRRKAGDTYQEALEYQRREQERQDAARRAMTQEPVP